MADTVRYISHREEGLEGGRTRMIYGGDGFRELRGSERAIIDRLVADGGGLKAPLYYRPRLTVNDEVAARLAELARIDSRDARARPPGRFELATNGGEIVATHGLASALLRRIRRRARSAKRSGDGTAVAAARQTRRRAVRSIRSLSVLRLIEATTRPKHPRSKPAGVSIIGAGHATLGDASPMAACRTGMPALARSRAIATPILLGIVVACCTGACGGSPLPVAPNPTPAPVPSPTATPTIFRPWPISGDYRLSITLGPSCQAVVLPRFHHRVWDVSVVNEGDLSLVTFVGPQRIFPDRTAIPCAVCGFVTLPPVERVHVRLGFQEDTGEYLLRYGLQSMDASVTGETVAGRALGFFSSVHTSAARVDCSSSFHDFALTPR